MIPVYFKKIPENIHFFIYWSNNVEIENSKNMASLTYRVGKNPGFIEKTQPTWVLLGFFGFYRFFSGFIGVFFGFYQILSV